MITNESFMRIANEIATNSKSVRLKVGAIIVNDANHIVGAGYNGSPSGSPLDATDVIINNQAVKSEPYTLHAELNAILNATTSDIKNCRIYCTHLPCMHCASVIIQKNIKTVFYQEEYMSANDSSNSLEYFKIHNIKTIKI